MVLIGGGQIFSDKKWKTNFGYIYSSNLSRGKNIEASCMPICSKI